MPNLDDTTRSLLRKEQKTNRDKRVFEKATVLLMLDQGFSIEVELILELTVPPSTVIVNYTGVPVRFLTIYRTIGLATRAV